MTRFNQRVSIVRVLALIVMLLATAVGAYAYGRSQSPVGISADDKESLALYAEALDAVQEDYVDQGAIDSEEQTYGAIKGMLESLGDEGHTRFLTPEEAEANRRGLSGTYVGIGVRLEDREGEVIVASPIEGSPADDAGLETGDVLVAVNGRSVEGENVSEIAEKVRGPEGTEVELTVLRDEEEREFSMERAELDVPAASWAVIPRSDVGHIQLSSFTKNSAGELAKAFEEARDAGAERFILDLRNNPGGAVDQVVEISESFLKPESVIYIREDASGKREEIKAGNDAGSIEAPLVVLVNEGSASSSEILAGALRDNDRATVVGVKTFGTGTVLSPHELSDGSEILLGVAEWLTPGGDFIRETGIEPDVRVDLEEGAEPLSPGEAKELSQTETLERDAQLHRAFEILAE